MFKNIQQYLLTHYPIVWNVKLIPMLIVTLAAQLIFFGVGYAITDNTTEYQSSTWYGIYFLIIAASYLVGTLFLIFWLIRYNRSNGLRAFYPYTNVQLYLEWVFIFIICIAIGFVPNSLSWGKAMKWQHAVPKSEQKDVMDLLHKVKTLLPTEEYYYELTGNQTPLRVGDAKVDRTKFDTKLYNYAEDAITPDNPIEYVGPSFLYYKDNGRNNYYRYDEDASQTIHDWMVNQNQDSIRATMQAFLDLQKKHGHKTNLDIDHWMSMVYNPPLYPVKEFVETSYPTYTSDRNQKYTEYYKLYNYYDEVGSNYSNYATDIVTLTVIVNIALLFSIFIFSARITSGRSWIFSLLSAGVITFVYSLLMGIAAIIDWSPMQLLVPLFWILLFISIAFVLTNKVVNKRQKGKSRIYLNLGLWLVPILLYLIYTLVTMQLKIIDHSSARDFSDEGSILIVGIINPIAITLAMFPIAIFLRKWKALPEN